ncbi:gamma-glutamyl transpeptidase [Naegleria gruberi]|uniref:Gamma-glutamyl transpeptidase n=1 Tax=Naegleria gruberi TaxID=5762 RepID=D2V544_NAEGR|nr:gamma-glutamyl transpeptidase [Naegleria gruberi]EFC48045.1 gamma-glutamyl transpeptidase [Naegleria gruberi]|eukprot:XP_002680789.1 gamma-glutamyl transpeptidase [Naegleria gruberi strain NEG-M]
MNLAANLVSTSTAAVAAGSQRQSLPSVGASVGAGDSVQPHQQQYHLNTTAGSRKSEHLDDTERDALSADEDVFPTFRSVIMGMEEGNDLERAPSSSQHHYRDGFGRNDDEDHDFKLGHSWETNKWLRIGVVVTFSLMAILLFAFLIVIITLASRSVPTNGNNVINNSTSWEPPVTESGIVNLIRATNGATAADNEICSNIGVKIMRDYGGNAVDAAIATSFCIGIMNPFSAGIGGGGIMAISKPSTNGESIVEYIDYRETAPSGASWDMFSNMQPVDGAPPSQRGGKSIAVLSEVKGLYTAWQRHGSISWNLLVEPSIELARNGVKANAVIAGHLQKYKNWVVRESFGSGMKQVYGTADGDVKKENDLLVYPKLAQTLEQIAIYGANALYSLNGSLIQDLLSDLQQAGSIVTMDDLLNYQVKIYSTLNTNEEQQPLSTYFMGYKVFGPRPVISGGSCIIFMLNMLENFVGELYSSAMNSEKGEYERGEEFHLSQKKYALFVEALKYAFAHRGDLADPDFIDIKDVLGKMTSKDYSSKLRNELEKALSNNLTFSDPLHYKYQKDSGFVRDDHGTSHLSVLDKNGMAVSATTTVNLIFGSFIIGERTGIIFNDQMDDFSLPNTTNYFGLAPSPSNYIAAGKRPLSSMSPMIIHKNNQIYLTIGASGGSRIISSVFQTIWNHIVGGLDIAKAIQFPRIHHQWSPDSLAIEQGIPDDLVSFLKNYVNGGSISRVQGNPEFSVGIVQGIVKKGANEIEAASDIRKKSKAAGY